MLQARKTPNSQSYGKRHLEPPARPRYPPQMDPKTDTGKSGRIGFIVGMTFFAVLRGLLNRSNREGSGSDGVAIRLRLAGVKPNSEAIRIMISAWRLAIASRATGSDSLTAI